MYQEDAEYYEHRRELVKIEDERRRDTGFVTDTSAYPWIEEGEDDGAHRFAPDRRSPPDMQVPRLCEGSP